MAKNVVLEGIAKDIVDIDVFIKDARELLRAAKEAGEDVSSLEISLREQEVRKERWKRMLDNRGIKPPVS